MAISSYETAALFGIVGIVALSLYVEKIARYFVGVGVFAVYFAMSFVLFGNPSASVFIGMSAAVFFAAIFDWVVTSDIYSAALLISLATIGYILAAITLTILVQSGQADSSLSPDGAQRQLHQSIIAKLWRPVAELNRP